MQIHIVVRIRDLPQDLRQLPKPVITATLPVTARPQNPQRHVRMRRQHHLIKRLHLTLPPLLIRHHQHPVPPPHPHHPRPQPHPRPPRPQPPHHRLHIPPTPPLDHPPTRPPHHVQQMVIHPEPHQHLHRKLQNLPIRHTPHSRTHRQQVIPLEPLGIPTLLQIRLQPHGPVPPVPILQNLGRLATEPKHFVQHGKERRRQRVARLRKQTVRAPLQAPETVLRRRGILPAPLPDRERETHLARLRVDPEVL